MQNPHKVTRPEDHSTFKSYLLGFLLSLVLTLAAYFIVSEKLLSGKTLACTLATLALVQMIVQFLLFFHLDKEPKPRWNLVTFLFMVLIVVIIVFGSLWIMYHLDYRMMPQGY